MTSYQYDKYRNSSEIPTELRWKVLLLSIRLHYHGSNKNRIHITL